MNLGRIGTKQVNHFLENVLFICFEWGWKRKQFHVSEYQITSIAQNEESFQRKPLHSTQITELFGILQRGLWTEWRMANHPLLWLVPLSAGCFCPHLTPYWFVQCALPHCRRGAAHHWHRHWCSEAPNTNRSRPSRSPPKLLPPGQAWGMLAGSCTLTLHLFWDKTGCKYL